MWKITCHYRPFFSTRLYFEARRGDVRVYASVPVSTPRRMFGALLRTTLDGATIHKTEVYQWGEWMPGTAERDAA